MVKDQYNLSTPEKCEVRKKKKRVYYIVNMQFENVVLRTKLRIELIKCRFHVVHFRPSVSFLCSLLAITN